MIAKPYCHLNNSNCKWYHSIENQNVHEAEVDNGYKKTSKLIIFFSKHLLLLDELFKRDNK